MCITALLIRTTGRIRFVMIGNRDELSRRGTRDIAEVDRLLCAVDEEAGGTQSALNFADGVVANLTNVRLQPTNAGVDPPVSRGLLVKGAALGHLDLPTVAKERHRYAGFNLLRCVLGRETGPRCEYVTNCEQWQGTGADGVEVLEGEGVHCVSNSYLNDDSWPKVRHLKTRLQGVVDALPDDVPIEHLMEAVAAPLCDDDVGAEGHIPENMSATPEAHLEYEAALQKGVWVSAQVPNDVFRSLFQTVVVSEVTPEGDTAVHYWYRSTHTATEHGSWRKFQYTL